MKKKDNHYQKNIVLDVMLTYMTQNPVRMVNWDLGLGGVVKSVLVVLVLVLVVGEDAGWRETGSGVGVAGDGTPSPLTHLEDRQT